LGVVVPDIRKVSREARELPRTELKKLLESPFHEDRLAALVCLVSAYERAKDEREQARIYSFYTRNFKAINNWDLVDVSAPQIVGRHLSSRPRDVLYQWALSPNLWKRRIAVVSTFTFIRQNEIEDTLALSKVLLSDKHDLIHKACGWMLREAWKRDAPRVERFLRRHGGRMPRTMLRYAIELITPTQRKLFLSLGR